MSKAVLKSNIFPIDTIQTIGEPVSVSATTTAGLTVTVTPDMGVGTILTDTIKSINGPVAVSATTAGGLTVTVPATTEVGAIVVLNSDGTAFETLLVEGFNLFSPVDAAEDITVIG
jgi:hypothetical protein